MLDKLLSSKLLISAVLGLLLMGIISSLMASYWPAKIAANIKPADAMRYE